MRDLLDIVTEGYEDQRRVLTALEMAAEAYGSPVKLDNGRKYMPEFDRIALTNYKQRFIALGKAGEFMQTPQAEQIVNKLGWIITVLKPRREPYGLDENGVQRYRDFVEVRLEPATGGETVPEWNMPKVLFHITPVDNVADIMAHGLEPREPTRPDMHRYPPRVHFATSHEAAMKMEAQFRKYDAARGIDRDYTLLAVNPHYVEPLYIDPEFHREGVFTDKWVSPDAISLRAA